VIFMSIELMLNAAHLALVAFGQRHGTTDGQAPGLLRAVRGRRRGRVGLAIIVTIFRSAAASRWTS